MTSKKDMLARLANVAKNAPLQETSQKRRPQRKKIAGLKNNPKRLRLDENQRTSRYQRTFGMLMMH